jgi:glycosyltransferase involved in cell wall biosynthesis
MSEQPVAIFIPSVHGGGAERAMLNFAEELLRRGICVELVLAKLEGAWKSMIPSKLPVVDLGVRRMAWAVFPLARYLRANRPKVLLSTISHANVAAVISKHISGCDIPVVIRQSNTARQEYKESLGAKLIGSMIPYIYSHADAIIAVSKSVEEDLIRIRPKLRSLITVIPTPALYPKIFEYADELPRHPWFQDKTVPIVVSVGRLRPHKGMYDLLRAFRSVRQSTVARLIIVGEGDDRRRLERFIDQNGLKDDVHLVGFTANPFSFMKHADVFVLASHYEGLPNVLIQALSLGVAVIATDSPGGVREVLANGRCGALVPVGEPDVLAQAIVSSLTGTERDCDHSDLLSRYDVQDATDRYVSLMKSAMNNRGRVR